MGRRLLGRRQAAAVFGGSVRAPEGMRWGLHHGKRQLPLVALDVLLAGGVSVSTWPSGWGVPQ